MARSLPVVEEADTVTIGGSTVVEPDVIADNGVIHVIDTVIDTVITPGA
jgi:uncharacterized surface protein with fasciclin (FAS1) repeats